MKTKTIEKVVEKVDEIKNKGRYIYWEYNGEEIEFDLKEIKKFLQDKKIIDEVEYIPQYFVVEVEEKEIKIPRQYIEEIVDEEFMIKRSRIKKTAKVAGAAISGVGVVAAGITAAALASKKSK
ncbi:hypothetical protein [Oceanirhabdus seepicola]|uniref:Uncharacterized protein n=1 Tax=Oceanirhabdus seepicola TaxID=2828781 RepID=A0A9J6NXT5_9CLOT|nr:hypothetical protein [Oceanirhabdus seepicola]MCM1988705.1 hypothetical protein [Oceanirhabdus seepicola]